MKEFRRQAVVGLSISLLCSCRRPSFDEHGAVLPSASAPASATAPVEKSRANLAASAVVAIREQRLSLRAPPELVRHLAFGRGFIAQATATEVVLRSSDDGRVGARLPLAARALLSLPAGSVLAVAPDAAHRVDPGQTRSHRLNRIWLLPDTLLLPDRTTQERVWVVHPGLKKAARHALDPKLLLGTELERPLEDYDAQAIAVLSDGDLLYSAGRELVRDPGFGRPRRFRLPEQVQRVWRLAAAERIDRVWLVTSEGAILLLELSDPPRIVQRIDTGLAPIDFAASRSMLALVAAREQEQKPREFLLAVFAADGKQRFSYALPPAEVTTDPDWAAKALRDREVVLSDSPVRVAVGGRSAFAVLEGAVGRLLASTPGGDHER